MTTVSFSYRSKKDIANIEVRFTFYEEDKRKSIYTRAPFEISKQFWEEYSKNTIFRDAEKKEKKKVLDKFIDDLKAHIFARAKKASGFNTEWLKNTIASFGAVDNDKDLPLELVEYFKYYLEVAKRNEITHPPTLRKWNVILNKLKKFEELQGTLYLTEINDNFRNAFIDWSKKQLYSAETIKKDLSHIKQICTHAQAKGLDVSPEIKYLKYRAEKETPVVYLSFEELEKIKKVEGLPEYLDNARDWLIISCYTGQRVSDFMRFSPEMIREDEMKVLEITQEKTNKQVIIPLMPEVLEILEKRKGEFPRPTSDQRYNDYIKKVCKKAKINEVIPGKMTKKAKKGFRGVVSEYPKHDLITSHTGRRSFATNYYGKIPTAYLKDLTGHGSEAMLLRYIGKKSDDLTKDIFKAMTLAH